MDVADDEHQDHHRIGDYEKALGNLLTLQSPYFNGESHHGIETESPVRDLEPARQNYFQR